MYAPPRSSHPWAEANADTIQLEVVNIYHYLPLFLLFVFVFKISRKLGLAFQGQVWPHLLEAAVS